MGNCLNPASKQRHGGLLPEEEESLSEMRRISQLLRDEEEDAVECHHDEAGAEAEEVEPPPPAAAEGLKVKVVLTRAELEWLMAQLKTGDRRIQDVLHHMQAAKANAADAAAAASPTDKAGWRPRLESILECQETTLVC
ncbi:unnamed protein product [Urochloa humidicola]